MATSFSVSQVKSLIKKHNEALTSLKNVIDTSQEYESLIKKNIESYSGRKTLELLNTIPVEEVNRDKGSFRVGALKSAGYNTIADIAGLTASQLTSIYGVGESSAYGIKQVASEIVSEARSAVRLSLSVDDKNEVATKIVLSIYQYRLSLIDDVQSRDLYRTYSGYIDGPFKDLQEYCKKKRFIFVSKAVKQMGEAAYSYLSSLNYTTYFIDIQERVDKAKVVKSVDASYAWQEFAQSPISYFNIIEKIFPDILGSADAACGLPEELAREIQDECFFPEGLLCELRRYQEWGVKYILHQEKVLLGDEMGLGKTIQAIATMVSLKNTGATHFMVICPASVLENWCREIRKQSLLTVTRIHGAGRSRAIESWLKLGGVAVTTFETTSHIKLVPEEKISLVVVDEAHYIKNPEAARTKNTQEICQHSERLLFMTGTALENKVDEMINLIGMLQPDIALRAQRLSSLSSAPQFRTEISPVYYRRKRDDVLTELPDKIEIEEWCTMNAKEESIYEDAVLTGSYNDARRVSWHVPDLSLSSKASRMLELIKEAESDGRKVIVFSFFRDTISKVSDLLGDRALMPITGSIPVIKRQEVIDEFEKAPAGTVLISQIQAGGTGLNIQSASVIFICKPQFKPSIENQAISRAYRMGQTRNVLVYRLLCKESVDERITDILKDKQKQFNAFADKSVAADESLSLDEATMGNIIKEEINRINAKRGIEQGAQLR